MFNSTRTDYSYRERLYPRMSTIFVAVLFVAMISIAYAAAISMNIGIVMFVLVLGGIFLGLWLSSPIISITGSPGEQVFTVAHATIPLGLTAHPRVLQQDELVAIRRGHKSPTAYLTTRGNLAAVEIEVIDAADPHNVWVVSTRRPAELCGQLELSRNE